jgi:hypothetical protein
MECQPLATTGKRTLSPAHCEFGYRWIVHLRRMSGLTGRTAAIDGGDERQQWAVSSLAGLQRKANPSRICRTSLPLRLGSRQYPWLG